MTINPKLKVGQIWCDSDVDKPHRYLLVKSVDDQSVECTVFRSPPTTRIRKDRMKPGSRGYTLVKDLSKIAKAPQPVLTPQVGALECQTAALQSRTVKSGATAIVSGAQTGRVASK